MKKEKYFTITNILIMITLIVYVLDKYIIDVNNGIFAAEESNIVLQILGLCGGKIYWLFSVCGTAISENSDALYRGLTYLFPHVFLLHLLVNMIGLKIAGNFIEKKIGSTATLLSFFLLGLGVYLVNPIYLLFNPTFDVTTHITAGASISVFGIMGIMLALCIKNKTYFSEIKKSHKITLLLYGIIFTYLTGSLWTAIAHNLGFILGIILGFIISYTKFYKEKNNI